MSLGFRNRTVALTREASQVVDVQLAPAATSLQEVRVYAKGGDPAYRVLREAARRRAEFDPNQLTAFQYDSYSRVEGYVNDFGQRSHAAGWRQLRQCFVDTRSPLVDSIGLLLEM